MAAKELSADLLNQLLDKLEKLVGRVEFGSIELVFHQGKLVQLEKNEKYNYALQRLSCLKALFTYLPQHLKCRGSRFYSETLADSLQAIEKRLTHFSPASAHRTTGSEVMLSH